MTTFQIFGVIVTVGFAAVTSIAALRGQIAAKSGVAWVLLWLAAAVAILRPDLTVLVAQALGIARGADLVFYCAILGMLIGFFVVYVKLRRTERTITLLVRQLALADRTAAPPAETADTAEREER